MFNKLKDNVYVVCSYIHLNVSIGCVSSTRTFLMISSPFNLCIIHRQATTIIAAVYKRLAV